MDTVRALQKNRRSQKKAVEESKMNYLHWRCGFFFLKRDLGIHMLDTSFAEGRG